MRAWFRQQITLSNILLVVTLIATLTMNTGRWVTGLSQEREQQQKDLRTLTAKVDDLTNRVYSLERTNGELNERVSKEFPRRVEVDLRLKNIESQMEEQSRMMRRLIERYQR